MVTAPPPGTATLTWEVLVAALRSSTVPWSPPESTSRETSGSTISASRRATSPPDAEVVAWTAPSPTDSVTGSRAPGAGESPMLADVAGRH